ncbi:dipeptidyl peptidase 1 [Anabrus simplex]|uniref:dipeptidyl peptidase 1 n=1 Tax=Anabrus simplex TaxID=316456 RepID=UPI0035A302FE
MVRERIVFVLAVAALFVCQSAADTPANCSYNDVQGKWIFYEGVRNNTKTEDCDEMGAVLRKLRIDLQYPNRAIDEYGNEGRWTMIYNQGFEVTVNERTYFSFSVYKQDGGNITSLCDRTFPGWSHDVTLRHWACFYGRKQSEVPAKVHTDPFYNDAQRRAHVPTRKSHEALVRIINEKQSLWRAKIHEPFVGKSHEELLKLRGGQGSWLGHRPEPAPVTPELLREAASLPKNFDWRNVNGINYVSPVRNQGSCGSCYAFSALGMLESRLRVKTNNTVQVELSPQDIVSCSQLSQGCAGGFPFLIAGRYGKDYGVVEEQCNPYQGQDGPCTLDVCPRYYTSEYQYVGGYYGGCNELQMQLALVREGPLSVSFEVESDFYHYEGGIYHHTNAFSFDPFVLVNHAVLLVGYGVDEITGENYWIVRNSWGDSWGENGYFRIRRGTNEVGIESIAVIATPIPF